MSIPIKVKSDKTTKLLTAGKYCAQDIVVTTDCAEKHFVHNFMGDGSGSVSFCVPFEPDALEIIAFDPLVLNTQYAVMSFCYDRRALGQCVGLVQYGNGSGGAAFQMFSDARANERYTQTQEGVVTLTDLGGTKYDLLYGNGFAYTVIATKYAEQTDEDRITAFVDRLTGSGTVSLQQAKVTAAFTDDEWAELIASKPEWTFIWI